MNNSVKYINQNYHDLIADHVFINEQNRNLIKKGKLIKAIDKNSLKLILNGKISDYNPNHTFIRSFNLINRRCLTLYLDKYYIFIKDTPNKKEQLQQQILSFIKSVEKNI